MGVTSKTPVSRAIFDHCDQLSLRTRLGRLALHCGQIPCEARREPVKRRVGRIPVRFFSPDDQRNSANRFNQL